MVKNLEFKGKPGGETRINPKRQNLIRLKGEKKEGKKWRERIWDQESAWIKHCCKHDHMKIPAVFVYI